MPAADLAELVEKFSKGALERAPSDWTSENSAHTYCRVRTLPLILEHAGDGVFDGKTERVKELIESAWRDVGPKSHSQGIAEHDGGPGNDAKSPAYPPNAFLTYWGLRALRQAQKRSLIASTDAYADRDAVALLWCERTLGTHVALASIGSDRFDPHQLAWTIAALVEFSPKSLREAEGTGLIKAGLGALFASQSDAGSWSKGEALFHYQYSGNAYCYTFETLSELIRPALRSSAQQFRDLLRPYGSNLLEAWRLADRTKEPLAVETASETAVGWCSGHHPHRIIPEAWASAAAFSYLQLLRRLVGQWSRDEAARELKASPTEYSQGEAIRILAMRGSTWEDEEGWDAASHLGSLFLNPVLRYAVAKEWLDLDAPLIGADQARSAIMFGPPGTSKTTLVRALAGAINWDYVEVQASDFVREGMDQVPARAEWIFGHAMQLDRCVVLFDEIDELLRDRGDDSDPFGRFLTTSMLPKLADLWEQRRILFFVNTNWIDKADPAIKRGQRFDATLFIQPPSFERKLARIKDRLSEKAQDGLTREAVVEALGASEGENRDLGWLALLTHDHMAELDRRLAEGGDSADMETLKRALAAIGTQLTDTDWHSSPTDDETPTPFERYRDLLHKHCRIDGSRLRLLRLDQRIDVAPDDFQVQYPEGPGDDSYLVIRGRTRPPLDITSEAWRAHDRGVLQYRVEFDQPNDGGVA